MNRQPPLHRLAAWRPKHMKAKLLSLGWMLAGFFWWLSASGLVQDSGPKGDRNHMAGMPWFLAALSTVICLVLTLMALWHWEEARLPENIEARIEAKEREAGIR